MWRFLLMVIGMAVVAMIVIAVIHALFWLAVGAVLLVLITGIFHRFDSSRRRGGTGL